MSTIIGPGQASIGCGGYVEPANTIYIAETIDQERKGVTFSGREECRE